MQRLVFKAHRLVYHSRVIKKKKGPNLGAVHEDSLLSAAEPEERDASKRKGTSVTGRSNGGY